MVGRRAPGESLRLAHLQAKVEFAGTSPSWNAVAGPTAALWRSLLRVNWQWREANLCVDDLGAVWDVCCDPPVAVMGAMLDPVRSMRVKKAAALRAQLIPPRADIGASCLGKQDIIVDFNNVLAPMANGKVPRNADAPEFLRKHASFLLSAVTGGQWPQAKQASVPK